MDVGDVPFNLFHDCNIDNSRLMLPDVLPISRTSVDYHQLFDDARNGIHVRLQHPNFVGSYFHVCALSPFVLIIPLFTAAVLLHPLRGHTHLCVCFSVAFLRSSAALNPTPMKQPNFSNTQAEVPLLVTVLVLSKLLQYGTNKYVFPIAVANNFCSDIVCCSAARMT